jgi:ATP-dependent exoDNAse (exonuclease V) beta subunit
MKSSLYPVLSNKNLHVRDKNIQFFELGHKYVILSDKDSKYTSVTTWIHSHFPKFDSDSIINSMMKGKNWKEGHKYWGKTKEEIKNMWNKNSSSVSEAGTNMHYEIECFMNNNQMIPEYTHKELYETYMSQNKNEEPYSLEWQYFIEFIRENPHLKPYRTEWIVFNEDLKLAGSIDMVYENPDGTLSIYDWKRSKEITKVNNWNKYATTQSICQIPDSNFWHYAIQLNTYKAILESKYNKKVTDLYLVRLHPDSETKTYELLKVPDLSSEVNELLNDKLLNDKLLNDIKK